MCRLADFSSASFVPLAWGAELMKLSLTPAALEPIGYLNNATGNSAAFGGQRSIQFNGAVVRQRPISVL